MQWPRYSDTERTFLAEHLCAVLATGREDGTLSRAILGYTVDDQGRLLMSTRITSAKWHNVTRRPGVSVTVPDGRVSLEVDGTAELFDADPEWAELSADVLAVVLGQDRPDPESIVGRLDQGNRGVIRITPERVIFHTN